MKRINFIGILVTLLAAAAVGNAQTSAFTYQGRLTDGGAPANGAYDLQFRLFDSAQVGSGNQVGSAINLPSVTATDGVFTVLLNYGQSAFSGADRFLEIGIRPVGSNDPYTILSPRRLLSSSVYSIRAASATTADQLGGVAANQYVQTTDSRLTDARVPTAGSTNYIQNGTAKQAGSNFNITGTGTANIIEAATEYQISGKRVLSTPGDNTFVGLDAGYVNQGQNNTFVGRKAGMNSYGGENTFVGAFAGSATLGAAENAFFGAFAGDSNTGNFNSFFGAYAGKNNKSAGQNSFFGNGAGAGNETGTRNAFFGADAGGDSTTSDNSYFGYHAGSLSTGASNSFFGSSAGAANITGFANSFFGKEAGIGNVGGFENVFVGRTAGSANVSGNDNTIIGTGANVGSDALSFATAIGSQATVNTSNTIVLGRSNGSDGVQVPGTLVLGLPGVAGNTSLCRNVLNQISFCSSSLRYKTNIQPFIGGLSILNRLRPITFDWRQGGMHDLGFGAEDIASVEPLLVTRNDRGEVEGVKYDRITAVLVNAVREQEEQISRQQSQLVQQQRQIEKLTRLVWQRARRGRVRSASPRSR